jgi:hypothetical protein
VSVSLWVGMTLFCACSYYSDTYSSIESDISLPLFFPSDSVTNHNTSTILLTSEFAVCSRLDCSSFSYGYENSWKNISTTLGVTENAHVQIVHQTARTHRVRGREGVGECVCLQV